MTVNYSIASTLTVKDELTAVLERIASIGRQVNAEMTNLTKNLSKLGTVFEKSSTSAGKFAETQGKAFSDFTADATRAAAAANNLNQELSALSRQSVQPIRAPNVGGLVPTSGVLLPQQPRRIDDESDIESAPRRMIDIGGHSTTDPYWVPPGGESEGGHRVGFVPSLADEGGGAGNGSGGGRSVGFLPGQGGNGGSGGPGIVPHGGVPGGTPPGGGAGGGGTGGGASGAGAGGGGLGGNGGLNGVAASYAGGMIRNFGMDVGGVLADATKDAAAYTHQLELMRVAGMSAKDVAEATTVAWKTSREVTTTTATSNLQMIGELRSVLPDVNMGISEAVRFLPQIAHLSAVMASVNGGKAPEGLAYTTMRAVEMLGGTVNPQTHQQDPERAAKMLDAITQATIMSHGRLTPAQLLGFAQQASAVVKNMDPTKVISQNAPLIMEMGGNRAGTALTSMNQQIVGGVMPQRVIADWEKYGLIDPHKVTATRTGVRLEPGAVKGEDVFRGQGGALDWLENVFIPQLQKAGLNNTQISDNIIRLFGRQTTQREAGLMVTQQQQIRRDIEMQKRASNAGSGYAELVQQDPDTLKRAYDAQKTSMMTAIGLVAMPMVIPMMQSITRLFTAIAEFATNHPDATKAIVMATAAVAGFAVVFGSILVVVGTIAAAVGAIAALGGGAAVAAIAAISAGIVALGAAVAGISWSGILSTVTGWLSSITSAVSNWISNLVNVVRSHLPTWLGGVDKPTTPGAASPVASAIPDASRGSGLAGPDRASNAQLASMIADKLSGVKVVLDGSVVGSFMMDHLNREASRPSTGTSGFDSRLNALRPDYGFTS
jgi:hypothetical protein